MKISGGGKVKWQETAKGRAEPLQVEREVALTEAWAGTGRPGFWISAHDLLTACNKTFVFGCSLVQ